MPKASFVLQNGTSVSIDGTTADIKELLAFYDSSSKNVNPQIQKSLGSKSSKAVVSEKKTPSDKEDLTKIVDLVKTCPEASSIEKYILDKTNEVNRVLLPLYIIHKYLDNAFGLSTSQISDVTIELGAKVSRQNVLRAIKFSGKGTTIKLGIPPKYKIHRQGLARIKAVISGLEADE
jgi:hypothetical protein